jgi:hypothetical protein
MIIKDIAQIIKRELRATSTALTILEGFEFIRIEKFGRSKRIIFRDRDEIIERLKKEGESPIKYTFYINSDIK